jgi:ribA/ribD-fused uncharacterized protein
VIVKIDEFNGMYRFLSNFYPCDVGYKGIVYPSVEHFYVALKVNSIQNIDGVEYTVDEFRNMIVETENPGKVKRIGRKAKIRKDWDSVKLKVMEYGVREKFTKNTKLKEMLLSTGDSELIEGNTWHDNFYGSCFCCGPGLNHLGLLLMKIRSDL